MLSVDFFKKNRNKLANELKDNSIAILFSGVAPKKSLDEQYPFAVNRNFYYETGINEDNDIFVLSKINGRVEKFLFIKKIDEAKARWIGKSLTKDEASNLSGIINILYLDEFDDFIHSIIFNVNNVYLDLEKQAFEDLFTRNELYANELTDTYSHINIIDCYSIIAEHRSVKEKEEVALIRKAIEITKTGIESLMKNAKSGIYEYQLEAYFDFEIKKNGATGYAFKTIAGSGVNGAVLHYGANNSLIEDNSLILFDLGAQYNLYNADITRTFPVSGKFSDRQKVIYDIVLRGQDLIISKVRPGRTLNELNDILKEYYIKELKKINLIKEDKELINYYFHGVSHHLGLDTHDACVRSTPLKEGAVITVEPGLYIEEEKIGIRIENDVLVTSDGCIDLASDIIKTIEDIENFMKK